MSEISTLQNLTQSGAAWLLNRTPRWLRGMPDAPRRADGRYNGKELVQWLLLRNDNDAALASGTDSPAIERLRAAKADLAELDLAERRGNMMPRADVHAVLTRLAVILHGVGDRLQRECGVEAFEILDEGLSEYEKEMQAAFEPKGGGVI